MPRRALTEEEKALRAIRAEEARKNRESELNNQSTTDALEMDKVKSLPKTLRQIAKSDGTISTIEVVPQDIRNTRGEEVDPADYFYASPGKEAFAPSYFNRACGFPVTYDEWNKIFDSIFDPEDQFVFLKSQNKEVYSVLVPLVFTEIGEQNDNVDCDFQVHAISFISDGSVSSDRLKLKLKEIAKRIGYEKRR